MEKAENEKPLFRTCVWFNSGRQNLQKCVETWHQSPPKSNAPRDTKMEPKWCQHGPKNLPKWSRSDGVPPSLGETAAYSRWTPLFWGVLKAPQTLPGAMIAPQDAPGCNPEAPRHRQDAPTRPKTHWDDPKTPKDAPKTLPRRLQETILSDFQHQN